MSRRIDIELTSARPDGSWTWRAAGAREPKGVVDATLVPSGVKAGAVLKADAEFELDGITILSLTDPKAKSAKSGLLELIPSDKPFEAVMQTLAKRDPGERPRRDRGDRPDRPRGDRPGGDRPGGPRSDRPGGDRPGGAPRGDRAGGAPRGDRPGGDRPGGDRPGGDRPPRTGDRPAGERPAGDRSSRPPRDRAGAPGGERRPPREGESADRPRGPRPERRQRPSFTPPPELPQRPKAKRLKPGREHRNAVLADLAPEQRPVAERALQGGIPAVRQAIQEQNARLRSEGKEEIPAGGVLSMAEQLLPRLRVAEWLDRAAAAKADLEELDLRDLRSVVAAADDPMVSRDEETRALAAELKQALVTKQEKELQLWFSDIDAAIGVGRVIRALKLSSQPPKAGIRFPAELARKLSEAANASLTADAMSDRWSALLEAVAFSPVRTQVNPTARPENPGDDLVASVTRLAPLLPQIAVLFGIDVKDGAQPPKPLRPTRPDKPATKKAVPQPPRPPKDKSERPPRAAPGGEDTPVEETAGDAAADLVGEPALAEPGGDIATIADAPAAAADEIAAAAMSTDATIEAPDDTSDASEAAAEPTSDTPAATTDAPDATTDAPDATTDAPDATSDAADATGDAPAATTDAPVAAADSTVDFVTEGPEEGSEPGVAMLAAIDPPAATDFAADGPESGAVEVDSTIGPDAGSDDAAPVAAHDAVGSDSLADDPG